MCKGNAQLTDSNDCTCTHKNHPGILYASKRTAWSPRHNNQRIPCAITHTLGKVKPVAIRLTPPDSNSGGSHAPGHRSGFQGTLIQPVWSRHLVTICLLVAIQNPYQPHLIVPRRLNSGSLTLLCYVSRSSSSYCLFLSQEYA